MPPIQSTSLIIKEEKETYRVNTLTFILALPVTRLPFFFKKRSTASTYKELTIIIYKKKEVEMSILVVVSFFIQGGKKSNAHNSGR